MLSEYIPSTVTIWNSKSYRLEIATSKLQFTRNLILHRTYAILLLASGAYKLVFDSEQTFDFTDQTLFFLAGVCTLSFHLLVVSASTNSSCICLYVNSLISAKLHFPTLFNVKSLAANSLLQRLNVILAYCGIISCVTFTVGFTYGIHWFGLCKPSLVGYTLIPECNCYFISNFQNTFWFMASSNILKTLVITANFWFYAFVFNIIPNLAGVTLILGTLSLWGLLDR